MFLQRRKLFARVLFLADLCVVGLAFWCAYHIRFPYMPLFADHALPNTHRFLGAVNVAAWPLVLWLVGLYDLGRIGRRRRMLWKMTLASVGVVLIVGSVIFFFQAKLASRMILAYAVAFSAGGLLVERWIFALAARRRQSRHAPRILVVGTGRCAARFGERIQAHPEMGVILTGYLRVDDEPPVVPEDAIVGSTDDLEGLLEREVIDKVAIAVASQTMPAMEHVVLSCEKVGVDITIVAHFFERLLRRASLDRLDDMPVLHLHATPQFRAIMAGKRVFDLVGSSALVVLLLPLMAVAALVVRLSSAGSALYVQERLGLNGRRFRLYKFRTMVQDAEKMRAQLTAQNEMNGPTFKIRRDPRVTPVGRLLRRFSIDELPQLFNVLKGDMSLVGPRPPLEDEVAQYDQWQRRRLSVKPGLTCTWQVSGRNEVDFDQWMKLDLEYINNWSPWLDLRIILRTIPAIISGRGAS